MDLAVVMNMFCRTRLDYCNSLKLKIKAPQKLQLLKSTAAYLISRDSTVNTQRLCCASSAGIPFALAANCRLTQCIRSLQYRCGWCSICTLSCQLHVSGALLLTMWGMNPPGTGHGQFWPKTFFWISEAATKRVSYHFISSMFFWSNPFTVAEETFKDVYVQKEGYWNLGTEKIPCWRSMWTSNNEIVILIM